MHKWAYTNLHSIYKIPCTINHIFKLESDIRCWHGKIPRAVTSWACYNILLRARVGSLRHRTSFFDGRQKCWFVDGTPLLESTINPLSPGTDMNKELTYQSQRLPICRSADGLPPVNLCPSTPPSPMLPPRSADQIKMIGRLALYHRPSKKEEGRLLTCLSRFRRCWWCPLQKLWCHCIRS